MPKFNVLGVAGIVLSVGGAVVAHYQQKQEIQKAVAKALAALAADAA